MTVKMDRLRNILAMFSMGLLLTIFIPWLVVQGLEMKIQETVSSAYALPESFLNMETRPLSEALPQCYRVEDTDGTILALTPQELLVRLAGKEWIAKQGGDEKILEQSLILRMILLHGKTLGIIGDRVEGMSKEELTRSVWLQNGDMPMLGTQELLSLSEKTLNELYNAADTAAPFFLSSDGMLVRNVEMLTMDKIYDRISAGETVDEIIKNVFGEGCTLEQAKS